MKTQEAVSEETISGCLAGTAVGDALGLAYEGLSRERAVRMLGAPDRYRFLFGRGMVSDDTEHTCLVVQSLIGSGGEPVAFQTQLARRMRRWFLCLPAGVGFATARSMIKSLVGYSPSQSGVFSAGNGPAMRSAIIGVSSKDISEMKLLVQLSCEITHRDPKAYYGAVSVALAAQMSAIEVDRIEPVQYLERLKEVLADVPADEFIELIARCVESVQEQQTTEEYAAMTGLERGVSGYVYHTVPVAIHAWLSHQDDYKKSVMTVIRCGGDTDTVAAIVGGIVGSRVGTKGIPAEWLEKLVDWPVTIRWMERLGKQLAETSEPGRPVELSLFQILPRNLLFAVVVLFHGFRRLFPPY